MFLATRTQSIKKPCQVDPVTLCPLWFNSSNVIMQTPSNADDSLHVESQIHEIQAVDTPERPSSFAQGVYWLVLLITVVLALSFCLYSESRLVRFCVWMPLLGSWFAFCRLSGWERRLTFTAVLAFATFACAIGVWIYTQYIALPTVLSRGHRPDEVLVNPVEFFRVMYIVSSIAGAFSAACALIAVFFRRSVA